MTEDTYQEDPNLHYTKFSFDSTPKGEITTDINVVDWIGRGLDAPYYEQDGDFDKSNSSKVVTDGFYYFLRPFPVEGVYVLEFYSRNDKCKDLDDQIKKLNKNIVDGENTDAIKNFNEDRSNITDKPDEKGFDHAAYTTQFVEAVNYFADFLLEHSNTYDSKTHTKEFTELNEVLNDSTATQAQKAAAQNQYNTVINSYHEYLNHIEEYIFTLDLEYSILFNAMFFTTYDVGHVFPDGVKRRPNENESSVESAKSSFERIVKVLDNNMVNFYKYASIVVFNEPFDASGSSEQSVMFTQLSNSYAKLQMYFTNLKDLDYTFWKTYLPVYQDEKSYKDITSRREVLHGSNVDKKFLAYKILNRNKDYPDKDGCYRIVDDLGSGKFKITTKKKDNPSINIERIIDNTKLMPDWETPDSYYIKFRKLENDIPEFRVYCNKDGFFSDTEGVISYIYKGNNSMPIIGPEFNPYGDGICSSMRKYKTEFKYLSSKKIYSTVTKNSKGQGNDKTRYNLFDARQPYPVEGASQKEQITLKEWLAKPKKEQMKYHRIGSPSMDVDMQKIMEAMEQLKPIISSLTPLTQIMGGLSPLISTLQSVESILNTVDATIGTVMSLINTIASLPIVGIVAKPLKGLLDIITGLAGAIVTFYMENYVLLKKIRTTLEQLKPEEIRKKLDDIVETIDAHYENLKEKTKTKLGLDENSNLKEIDKKKMNIESPTTAGSTVEGSGNNSFANFNAKNLIPDIPEELKTQIETVKTSITTTKQIIDKAVTLSDYGNKVDQAMTKISQVKAIITATPPMEMITEQIRQAAKVPVEQMKEKMEEFEKKQLEMEQAAKQKKEDSLKYERVESVDVEVTFKDAVDAETIKARSNPKVKG